MKCCVVVKINVIYSSQEGVVKAVTDSVWSCTINQKIN